MDKARLEAILDAVGVYTKQRIPRKNSTRNAVNINCPFCGDTKAHLGIFTSNLRFNCWRCKATGSLRFLLTKLGLAESVVDRLLSGAIVPRDQAVGLAEEVRRRLNKLTPPPIGPYPQIELPPSWPIDDELVEDTQLLAIWLGQRKITVETAMRYDARWTGNTGQFPHRIVMPIYDSQGQVAAWQARDASGKAKTKYLTQGRISELVYWTDLIRLENQRHIRLYVVEGIFDAWRMDINTVATFSHAMSRAQRVQIINEPWVREVVLAWDADSYELGKAAARRMSPVVRAGVVRLPTGEDPDSLGPWSLLELPIEWV